jgi:hypothetical protein
MFSLISVGLDDALACGYRLFEPESPIWPVIRFDFSETEVEAV